MDLFSFIKSNVDILSIVEQYTSLKKTGSLYWKGRCPFHHEKTPSFTVSPHRNIYYCFGCHATGDVINFIEKIEHISAFEAAQHLVQRCNLDVPKEILQTQSLPVNKTYYQLCLSVATWCNNMLPKYPLAAAYLQKRSLNPATIAHFMIGYFPNGSRSIQQLIAHVTNQGFSAKDLIEANILLQGKQGLYSPYENRIIFPIKEHLGQVCGFGGRIFLPDDTRPKYYNSMDSVYFKKGKLLFGLDSAKHEIQKKQSAVIVEGYMDSIALWQHGFKNSVATLGTACSIEHLQQLTKHAQTLYLLYDADAAGKQAIMRLASSCWQFDLDLKVITLPQGQDPASMLENQQNIQPYFDQALDIFNFFVAIKTTTFAQDSMKHKMSTLLEIFEIVSQVQDSLKQNVLLIKASEALQIPLDILKNEYNKKYASQAVLSNNSVKHQHNSTPTSAISSSSPTAATDAVSDKLEQQIIAILGYNPHIMTEQHELLLTTGLSSKALLVVQSILEHRKTDEGPCSHTIEEMIDENLIVYVRSLMFTLFDGTIEQTFQNLMVQFQKKYWKSIASTIKIKITQAIKNHNEQEVQRLLTVFEQLKLEVYKNGRL